MPKIPKSKVTVGEPESVESGVGLDLFKRKAGVFPPAVETMLKKIGNEPIRNLRVIRTPISKFVKGLLNTISAGTYSKALAESPYDTMFHLALHINGKYTTDKQSVVTLTQSNPITPESNTMTVFTSKLVTIQGLLENARNFMGPEKFSNYDARRNNCQDYVLGVLEGSNMLNEKLRQFIKQDAEQIFRKMPSISDKIGVFLTDLGAVADRVVNFGAGTENYAPGGTNASVPQGEVYKEEWIEIGTGMYHFPLENKMQFKIEKPIIGGSYSLYQNGEDCWTLMNIETGKVHGYCMKEQDAKKQLNLLQRIQNEETTKNIVKSDIEQKKKIKSYTKTKMQTWREFYSQKTKGKKFGSRAEVNEWMRKCSAEYKAMKAKSK